MPGKPGPRKTHAMRLLEAEGVAYRATVYDASGGFHAADEAAAMLGIDLASMYKTLVVLRDPPARRKALLAMLPSIRDLDLKGLAAALGEKRVRMATRREAEQLTGMQAGGISVLGLKKPAGFEVLLDEAARSRRTLHISAGERGIEIELDVRDLVRLTGARFMRTAAPPGP